MKKKVFVIAAIVGLMGTISGCGDRDRPDYDENVTTTTTGGTTGYNDDLDDDELRDSVYINDGINNDDLDRSTTTGGVRDEGRDLNIDYQTTTTGGVVGPTGTTGTRGTEMKKDQSAPDKKSTAPDKSAKESEMNKTKSGTEKESGSGSTTY